MSSPRGTRVYQSHRVPKPSLNATRGLPFAHTAAEAPLAADANEGQSAATDPAADVENDQPIAVSLPLAVEASEDTAQDDPAVDDAGGSESEADE